MYYLGMDISELLKTYGKSQHTEALRRMMGDASIMTGYVKGCVGSAAAMLFASVADKADGVCLFVLDDAEQAGYFYHDLTQMLGNKDVLFFPSSYRRRTKYGQRDAANEILRTEVMGRLLERNKVSAADSGPDCAGKRNARQHKFGSRRGLGRGDRAAMQRAFGYAGHL